MEKQPLPKWLTGRFSRNGWWDMSKICDWADGLFTKMEFSIEVFRCKSHGGTESYRLLATVDGKTYIGLDSGFVTDATMVSAYIKKVMPKLEMLLAGIENIEEYNKGAQGK